MRGGAERPSWGFYAHLAAVALAAALAGCAGSFSIPPERERVEVVKPETPELDIWCFQRARNFSGLVAMRCSDVAREIR